MASGFEEVTAEDVASDVKGLKFFGKEDNEKLNDESNADSIYVISQKTGSSEVRKRSGFCFFVQFYFEKHVL